MVNSEEALSLANEMEAKLESYVKQLEELGVGSMIIVVTGGKDCYSSNRLGAVADANIDLLYVGVSEAAAKLAEALRWPNLNILK